MRRVKQAIVVEGKHDVIRVRSAVEAVVVPTDGFRLFKDPEKMALPRRLAATRGLIILTDSDPAGGVIRNHLCGCIPAEQMRQAYIPPRPGKERRKAVPSKEGLLGVEGMDTATIVAALERAGAVFEDAALPPRETLSLTKADLMRIITEPKNSIIKQYQASLALDHVELEFLPEAIEAIAEKSLSQKTGARGLRSIVENIMIDVMYDIPSMTGVKRVVVNRDTIEKSEQPQIIMEKAEIA
jgi:ribonuclease M5